MNTKTANWESMSPQEKADILKGNLSYKEHYGYLMDWYMNDRKETNRIRGGISLAPESEMHESLKDVLEALKELNAKVNGEVPGSQKVTLHPTKTASKPTGNLFSRLIERQYA